MSFVGAMVSILPTTNECFYVRDSVDKSGFESLTCDQAELLKKILDIHVKGDAIPTPVLAFSSCGLPRKLLQNIETARYCMSTPVQMQVIPATLDGKSLLVLADTGFGKTASFLIPIISLCPNFSLNNFSNNRKPLAMVLTPTRELCIQAEDQAKLLGKGLPFKTSLVLIDLFTKHDIELNDVKIFGLDEVDYMLQSGFRDQVMQIFRALSQPQVLMYSATISQDMEKIASSMATDIITVSIGKPNRPSKAVKQLAIWVESKQKKEKLFDLLRRKHFTPPIVVYVSSRVGADFLSNAIFVTTRIKFFSINEEKSMKERREILRLFLVGEVPVVVSTGILGRGINLIGVR
ncbi:hypothetical protein DITRI_Ditri16bG0157000 [Diplodiscus trichospermus]